MYGYSEHIYINTYIRGRKGNYFVISWAAFVVSFVVLE